jgi:hypothetical protein
MQSMLSASSSSLFWNGRSEGRGRDEVEFIEVKRVEEETTSEV